MSRFVAQLLLGLCDEAGCCFVLDLGLLDELILLGLDDAVAALGAGGAVRAVSLKFGEEGRKEEWKKGWKDGKRRSRKWRGGMDGKMGRGGLYVPRRRLGLSLDLH